MAKKPHCSRNKTLSGGISKLSRSAMYRKKALYKKKKIPGKAPVKKSTYFSIKPIKGEKNGEKRVVLKSKAVSFLNGAHLIIYVAGVLLFRIAITQLKTFHVSFVHARNLK